ncbi:MAG: thioredoxin domain-containing protein, partial [Candidatus Fervidibacter sp.]|uniref:thioredoxin domain-containing protein n=3 Tax=Candidatus Fervidibacter sp. TaxID=3100871 RepID=UPI004049EF8D
MRHEHKPSQKNRLAKETSPYLLQHADNPVDWYPWGDEAFEKAKREDKPIFLSVGYSTCHWCHVMERESFENEEIARILNEHFVSIKLDREERPDVDEIYMRSVLIFTGGHGGWPMSVFLTPNLKPFFGGTYFPPEQFQHILLELARLWRDERQKVLQVAEEVSQAVAAELSITVPIAQALDEQVIRAAEELLLHTVDKKYGGFGGAPKFPPHQSLEFLLRRYEKNHRLRLWEITELTLKQMSRGGIYDQIGGGFHRYSMDEKWLVPHFEKMLYDNAQLAQVYAWAYAISGDKTFRRIAEETYLFVLREMTSPEGAFYSALDAESLPPASQQLSTPGSYKKEEGAFYLWRPDEVKEVLGEKDGALFCEVYDITDNPNFFNPHTGYSGSIPNLLKAPVESWAKTMNFDVDEFLAKLDEMRRKILEARNNRPRPHCDDKVLTNWNALMIRSFAWGYYHQNDERYKEAAERAAEFLWATMRKPDGTLWHSYRNGIAKVDGMLDDYAFLLVAFVDLHTITGDRKWLDRAKTLADTMVKLFWDDQAGGFWVTVADSALIARSKNALDGSEPSGNGMAALGLLRLANKTRNEHYAQIAKRTIETFGGLMIKLPFGTMTLLSALDEWLTTRKEVIKIAEQPLRKIWVEPERLTIHAGQTATIKLHIELTKGWHINSYEPQPNLLPTQLAGDAKLVTIERVEFPPGKKV